MVLHIKPMFLILKHGLKLENRGTPLLLDDEILWLRKNLPDYLGCNSDEEKWSFHCPFSSS